MVRPPVIAEPEARLDVRRLRRDAKRQVRRAQRNRRAGIVAIAAALLGAFALIATVLWPAGRRPSTVQGPDTSSKRVGPPASVPSVTTAAVDIEGVIQSVPTVSPTTAPGSARPSATVPASPAATIALPRFNPPALPPIALPPEAHAPGETVKVAVRYGVNNANPHLTTGVPNDNVGALSLVLPQPFRVGSRGEPILDQELVVEAGLVEATPRSIVRYVLRADALWSDGAPVSCDDFRLAVIAGSGKWVERSANSEVNLFRTAIRPGYQRVGGINCSPDGREVTVVFDGQETEWQWLFDGLLPSHVVKTLAEVPSLDPEAIGADEAKRLAKIWNESFALLPGEVPASALSAGPFRIAEISKTGVTFAPNPKFWGTPPASQAGFVVSATGGAAPSIALRDGKADLAALESDAAVVASVTGGKGASVASSEAVGVHEIVVNFQHPQLQSRAVRQALSACIDQTSLVASRVAPTLPTAQPTTNRMVRPFEQGFRSTKDPALAGSAAARSVLASAGFTFEADGLARRNGVQLVLRVTYEADALNDGVADAIAAQCAPAGFLLEPTPVTSVAKTVVRGGEWDLALRTSPTVLHTSARSERFVPKELSNVGNYGETRVRDALLLLANETDPAIRAERWNEIDALLWIDVPTIPLYTAPTLAVHAEALTGVAVSPGPAGIFGSARAWR